MFLLDEHQNVRPGELGNVKDIERAARARGLEVHAVNLNAQLRCLTPYDNVRTVLYRRHRGCLQERFVSMPATKDARLNLRLNQDDDELIRQAAHTLGQTVSDFLTDSAIDRAHEVLANQRHFVLDEETWDEFVALVDQPARPDPRLLELFARPQRIER